MKHAGSWYQRLQGNERQVVEEFAEWLRPVPWQQFVTLEFPWNARHETANNKLKELMARLGKELNTRICYVAALESESKTGMPLQQHFHVLLASLSTIPGSLVRSTWMAVVGRTSSDPKKSDLVDIKSFNSELRSVEYLFKHVARETEWDMRWVELFHPGIGGRKTRNHRSIRQKRRWDAQLARIT
jgi:hypothetical protein